MYMQQIGWFVTRHFNLGPFTIEVDNLHLQETVKHDFIVFIFF